MALITNENTGELQTPEELAHDALQDVEFIATINQNQDAELDVVARYMNRTVLLAARNPEKLWNQMRDTWRNDAIVELIKAKAKIINDQLDKKERETEAQKVYVAHLVSTGMSYTDARKKATGK